MRESERRISRSPEADDDLVSMWLYGANEWSPEQADKHLFEIESTCDRLVDDPGLGRTRDELVVGLQPGAVIGQGVPSCGLKHPTFRTINIAVREISQARAWLWIETARRRSSVSRRRPIARPMAVAPGNAPLAGQEPGCGLQHEAAAGCAGGAVPVSRE